MTIQTDIYKDLITTLEKRNNDKDQNFIFSVDNDDISKVVAYMACGTKMNTISIHNFYRGTDTLCVTVDANPKNLPFKDRITAVCKKTILQKIDNVKQIEFINNLKVSRS